MKFNGENIEIGPLDLEKESSISKGNECTRFDLVKLNIVRIFVDTILSNEASDEKKDKDVQGLRLKISNLLKNENTVLLKCAEKIIPEEHPNIVDVELLLNKLIEQLMVGDKEAGQKILDIFEAYDSFQKDIYEKSTEKVPELKKIFIEKIRKFSNDLKQDFDLEKVEKMVNHAKVIFHDNSLFQSSGGHNPFNEIYINIDTLVAFGADNSSEMLSHALFHELTHAISSDWDNMILRESDLEPLDTRSSGVKFSGFNKDNKDRGFVWLNEAFTEAFSTYVLGSYDVGFYKDEINIVNLLSQKGNINLMLKLSEIYFRHVRKTENKTTTSTEDWRTFSKQIDSIFGERFLVKLDIFIATHGIDKTIEIIQKWEDGKPQIEDFKIEKPQAIA